MGNETQLTVAAPPRVNGFPSHLGHVEERRPGATRPDVVVHVCCNSLPARWRLPRQWEEQGARVAVHEVPCSGKTDCQYLMHDVEAGLWGAVVVACPRGECRLGQGNTRAEMRVRTLQRLLAEIGLEPGRAELVRSSSEESPEAIETRVREAVARICAFGASGQTIE